MSSKKKLLLLIVLMHVFLGFSLVNPIIAKIYGQLIFVIGLMDIIISKNNRNQVMKWSMYIMGVEVLMRMTSGFIFSEFAKYAITVYIVVALLIEKKKQPIQVSYIIYLLTLLIAIAFVPYYDLDKIRQEVAFNLSGPFLLGFSSIYFYNRRIEYKVLLKSLYFFVLPLITMSAYLFYKTPNLREIVFKSAANFDTTAGFGPNQVATSIGFGIFIMILFFLLKKRITGFLILDLFILIYLIFRGLLTFSRGGMIAGLFGIIVFSFYFSIASKKRITLFFKYLVVSLILLLGVFVYTSSVTNGILTNRYTGKNTFGETKEDLTSGRTGYLELELQAFYENPIFGVGAGGSKYYRNEHTSRFIGSSHNEMSRLLSEHGIFGLLMLLFLIIVPLKKNSSKSKIEKAFLYSFYLFWFLTINHSAMRLTFPAFIYSISLMNINFNEKNTLHRK